jgi:hypothetical protein
MTRRLVLCRLGLIFALCGWVIAQDQEKLSPRELFYKKPQSPSRVPARPNPPRPAPANTQSPPSQPALQPATYTPLGLRYGILMGNSGSQYSEVQVDTVFRSGDSIRVSIESNDDAYLYIVNKGAGGTWSLLFPSADIDKGNNRVTAHRRYEIPSQGRFTFVDPSGEEHLFVVLSREPEPDLEKLIYSLGRPAATPSRPEPPVLTVQAVAINDDVVGKLRNAVARDLVFEKVNDDTSDRKEKAAYVVNATGGSLGRVVADLSLKHQGR